MINNPKVIKDELFGTLVIKNICEIINDSLVIVYFILFIKNWTKKLGEYYFYIYNIYYYRFTIYNFKILNYF